MAIFTSMAKKINDLLALDERISKIEQQLAILKK